MHTLSRHALLILCVMMPGCEEGLEGSNGLMKPDQGAYDLSAHDHGRPGQLDMGHTGHDAALRHAPDQEKGDDLSSAAHDMVQRDEGAGEPEWRSLPLKASVTQVQPMTGVVLWADSWNEAPLKKQVGLSQLEYAYVGPDRLVKKDGSLDWSPLDALLDEVAGRGHQAIVRFYYVYPGRPTTVPAHIKSSKGYTETKGQTEGKTTWFPDWSSQRLQDFHLDFYTQVAKRYDQDERLAFLQTGFGLWGEYHIYEGPRELGTQFPSKEFQRTFLSHMANTFSTLKWSVSIDAGDPTLSPLGDDLTLQSLPHGLFDDSFMQKDHAQYNESMWERLNYKTRFLTQPHGGEFSYYSDFDQKNVLRPEGIHGRSVEALSAKFHISYMIGNDQPSYHPDERIVAVSQSMGYRFRITEFRSSATATQVRVRNEGVAPPYYNAWVVVDGVRGEDSLRGLAPGQSKTFHVPTSADTQSVVSIQGERLVAGQTIEFEADLP